MPRCCRRLRRIQVQQDSIIHPTESEYRSNPTDHPLLVDGMYVRNAVPGILAKVELANRDGYTQDAVKLLATLY